MSYNFNGVVIAVICPLMVFQGFNQWALKGLQPHQGRTNLLVKTGQ